MVFYEDIVVTDIGPIAWNRWKIIGEAFSDLMGQVFAVLFYFTIFVPFALGVRLLSDPLRSRHAEPNWVKREPVGSTLEEARRQF